MRVEQRRRPQPFVHPPYRVGLSGQRPEGEALGHTVRDGKYQGLLSDVIDTGER